MMYLPTGDSLTESEMTGQITLTQSEIKMIFLDEFWCWGDLVYFGCLN